MQRFVLYLLCFVALPCLADDGAASIAAGGLIVMKREPRIVMAKEVLEIGRKVRVEYEFRNDSDEDVTTEVAFPVPPYSDGEDELLPKQAGFDDFKLWINGSPTHFETEIRAKLKDRDVTLRLKRLGIDIAHFNHHYDAKGIDDGLNTRFTENQLNVLRRLHLLDGDWATWTVEKRYHWTQTFPTHAVVKIRHEYSPVYGAAQVPPDYLPPNSVQKWDTDGSQTKATRQVMNDLCVSSHAQAGLSKAHGMIFVNWIDFILTTANTWKQPIEDFTLIVDRDDPKQTVSFCWDGPVEKTDANHFRAHTTNLIPKKELRIGYYSVSKIE